MKQTINTNLRDDGTLEIFIGNNLLAEIENGKQDEAFIDDVLNGMGYIWNKDGTITKMETKISDVKVGDIVVCFDEYSHDYCEHLMRVDSIENDEEEGVVLYGTDLEEEEYGDDYISRVNAGNFVCIKKN